jgi:transposase-like protein
MENSQEPRYFKRTQKDYTMSFKLQIIQEIERGRTGCTNLAGSIS